MGFRRGGDNGIGQAHAMRPMVVSFEQAGGSGDFGRDRYHWEL